MEEPEDRLSVRWMRNWAARWHDPAFVEHEVRSLLTDDFERVDHRRLVGVPGTVGRDEYVRQQKSFTEVGSERPTVELLNVLGTRGDRCVAMREQIVYPDGAASEGITVRTFDEAVEKCARLAIFDADEVESALNELDRQASSL